MIFIWSQKYFLYSPEIKSFKQPVPLTLFCPVSYEFMLTEIPIKTSDPTFFPADVSIILYSSVRGVGEKSSSGRTGKVARPNMDIVDCFFSLLVHRPWSMQRFSFRCVGQEWGFTFIFFFTLCYTQLFNPNLCRAANKTPHVCFFTLKPRLCFSSI